MQTVQLALLAAQRYYADLVPMIAPANLETRTDSAEIQRQLRALSAQVQAPALEIHFQWLRLDIAPHAQPEIAEVRHICTNRPWN